MKPNYIKVLAEGVSKDDQIRLLKRVKRFAGNLICGFDRRDLIKYLNKQIKKLEK